MHFFGTKRRTHFFVTTLFFAIGGAGLVTLKVATSGFWGGLRMAMHLGIV